MELLRVRVELADEPGALARLTTALSELGVDIASVDVLEVDGITVVDELVLRLPASVGPRDVEEAVRLAAAGDVLSTHTAAPRGDAIVHALELLASVLAVPGDSDAADRGLAGIAYADAGALLDLDEASSYPLAQRALEQGVPISARSAPDASPLAVPISATEAARLRAFVTLLENNQALRIVA